MFSREVPDRGDLLGGFLQVAGTRVIAESGPHGEQFSLGCGGQILDAGILRKEAFVVWNDGGDTRLLQHNLGNPDRVGIVGATPRQVALMLDKPAGNGLT